MYEVTLLETTISCTFPVDELGCMRPAGSDMRRSPYSSAGCVFWSVRVSIQRLRPTLCSWIAI